jgi:hypothetical protein
LDNFGLPSDSLCIYLTLKVTNSALAKTKFEEIINSLLAMISAFAPPEYADQAIEAL